MKTFLLALLACVSLTGTSYCKNNKGITEDAFEIIKPSPEVQKMLKRICTIDENDETTEKKIIGCLFIYTSKKRG